MKDPNSILGQTYLSSNESSRKCRKPKFYSWSDICIQRDAGTSGKRKEDQPSSSTGKRQKTYAPRVFQGRVRGYQGQG